MGLHGCFYQKSNSQALFAVFFQALRKRAAEEGCEVVVVSAKVESELNGMPAEEAAEWLEMLGVEAGEGGGLAALIRATYKTLGLQTYFTTGRFTCRDNSCTPKSGVAVTQNGDHL